MIVEDYPVGKLEPNPENPRVITNERFLQLVYSLKNDPEMLRARPVVALPDGRVIMGNMRLRAALELGWETIPTVIADIDEQRARLWLLRDNQEYGDWHEEQLAEMLYNLAAADVDLALTGFDDKALQRLIDSVAGSGVPGADGPEAEPVDVEAETEEGEIVMLGDHIVICGDATSAEDRDKLFKAAGVSHIDLCFTSPPYAGLRSYDGVVADKDSGASDAVMDDEGRPEHLAAFIENWAKLTKIFAVNLGLVRKGWEISTFWDHYIEAAHRASLKLVGWNVWDRGAPRSIGHHIALFPVEHEFIFVFSDGPFEQVPIVPNKASGFIQQRPRYKREGSHVEMKGPRQVASHRNLGSVIRLPPETRSRDVVGDHPAPYPPRLPGDYMRALTPRGGVVLDPFLGSGTTLIAAEILGRRCLGIERNPRYVDEIKKRWARNLEKPEPLDVD